MDHEDGVMLRNGARELRSLVATIYMKLEELSDNESMVLLDLFALSRNPEHLLLPHSRLVLLRDSLLELDGRVNNGISNIVLASIVEKKNEDGIVVDMVLSWPIVEPNASEIEVVNIDPRWSFIEPNAQ